MIFDPNLYGTYVFFGILFCIAAVWPKETVAWFLYLGIEIRLFILKVQIAIWAFRMLLKLRRLSADMGIEAPEISWENIWPSEL